MNRTLFELSNEIMELNALLDTAETDEGQLAILSGYIQTLGEDLETKLDNYAALISELEARSEARKNEAQRMMDRSKVDASKAQNLKYMLRLFFQLHKIRSYETSRYRVTLAQNGGKLPVMIEVEPEELPAEYVEQVINVRPVIDRIREALESGEEIPGCSLGQRGSSIRIK